MPKPKRDHRVLTLKLDSDFHRRVKFAATYQGVTMLWVAKRALARWLKVAERENTASMAVAKQ